MYCCVHRTINICIELQKFPSCDWPGRSLLLSKGNTAGVLASRPATSLAQPGATLVPPCTLLPCCLGVPVQLTYHSITSNINSKSTAIYLSMAGPGSCLVPGVCVAGDKCGVRSPYCDTDINLVPFIMPSTFSYCFSLSIDYCASSASNGGEQHIKDIDL